MRDDMGVIVRISTVLHVNEIGHSTGCGAEPEILEFAFEMKDALIDPDVLRQSWPQGKVFRLEGNSDVSGVSPAGVVMLSTSMGETTIAVQFPQFTILTEIDLMNRLEEGL